MFQLFGFSSRSQINELPQLLSADPDARVIDVRTEAEYRSGHIPGSISVPLGRIELVKVLFPARSTRLLAYCRSGARSAQAVFQLHQMGYANVENLGGLNDWDGELETGN